MSFDTIANILKLLSILGSSIGLLAHVFAKTINQKKIAQVILIAGVFPLGFVCGFIFFGTLSDMGWLVGFRGEQGFFPVIILSFIAGIYLSITTKKYLKLL